MARYIIYLYTESVVVVLLLQQQHKNIHSLPFPSAMLSKSSSFFLFSLLLLASNSITTSTKTLKRSSLPAPVSGLAYGFYKKSCPQAESLVLQGITTFLSPNISKAGAVIRLPFHDCFIQGCDASLLLKNSDGEQAAVPNLTIRKEALEAIDQIKASIEDICPQTVSCADIVVLAGREAAHLAGAPFFEVPTGRLDGLSSASIATTSQGLPRATATITDLISTFQELGLNETDLVALSGAHTVGIAHCGAFNNSLFPNPSSLLQSSFAQSLRKTCSNSNNEATEQDPVTPHAFDNQYFKNMLKGKVLLDSDRALLDNTATAKAVKEFAESKQSFFLNYAVSYIKMSMISVIPSSNDGERKGNIRKLCSVLNSATNGNSSASGVNMLYTARDSLFHE